MKRRTFVQGTGAALACSAIWARPLHARDNTGRGQRKVDALSKLQASTLERIGDLLLPGAAQSGIVDYVEAQLARTPDDCMLVAKYFNIEPPYSEFYRIHLRQIMQQSEQAFGRQPVDLSAEQAARLIERLRDGNVENWNGVPAPIVYLILRGDAIDVVYGTVSGFKELAVPYMPHILPPERW